MLRSMLFSPHNPASTPTAALARSLGIEHPHSYQDLYHWSCTHPDLFWRNVALFDPPVIADALDTCVSLADPTASPDSNPQWFSGARLNWAENMLRQHNSPSAAGATALIQLMEPVDSARSLPARRISYSDLYSLVADVVSALCALDVCPGDRIASYSSNCVENCAALLAAAAIGAIWVGAASDFGPDGVLERFEQVTPKVLFAVDAVIYNGKTHDQTGKLLQILQGLSEKGLLPTKVVLIQSNVLEQAETSAARQLSDLGVIRWGEFVAEGSSKQLGRKSNGDIDFVRLPFDWPLWILFSSGTTGKPKPIVHRAGGMLLQSKKELAICADIKQGDIFFYYTTTGWMMYNFLVAGLQTGCALVLYDGSPLRDPPLLWRWVDELKITHFGTSAKYLDALSRIYKPREHHSLVSLNHIYSTGSPLSPALFDYVYEHIHPNVLLGSITGGTDICSLFAGMNTSLPVYRGEIQCRMLGMAVEAYLPDGTPAGPGIQGELVCTKAFPCQPLGFWPLPGYGDEKSVEEAQRRYYQSYFAEFKGVWYHGDHVIITESRSRNGGGVIMLGRSDGVLNPGGVRFGTAEIYEVIESCFSQARAASPEHVITDCIAVGQSIQGGADERVILFVTLPASQTLSPTLEMLIKTEIRGRRTARHVPAKIIQVRDIPQTLNGKRVEVPIKKIINGAALSTVNPATLKNPESLAEYEAIGVQLRKEVGSGI